MGKTHLKKSKREKTMESDNRKRTGGASFMKTKVVLYWSRGTEK